MSDTDTVAVTLAAIGKKYAVTRNADAGKRSPFSGGHEQQARFWALRNVSLTIRKGSIIGLVGRNGSGKTTLLSIIAGITVPSEGTCSVSGRVASLFNIGTGFQDELSGRENIYLNGSLLGMTNQEIDEKRDAIIAFSELHDFINVPLGQYSQGMRLRLGFSIAAHLDFDIMVIDEVLMVGDGAFQKKCFEALDVFRKKGRTMVITTQALEVIERLCDTVVLLEQGRLECAGEPHQTVAQYKKILYHDSQIMVARGSDVMRQTKWWVEPEEEWGTREGTREACIDRVRIRNKWGRSVTRIRPGEPVSITLDFSVSAHLYKPHIGIALFRDDGVYCFGPNTVFDDIPIDCIAPGKGSVRLTYKAMCLMPGRYRWSVVVWDEKETLAYDYLKGYFSLDITGDNPSKQLLVIPKRMRTKTKKVTVRQCMVPHALLSSVWMQRSESTGGPIRIHREHHDAALYTYDALRFTVEREIDNEGTEDGLMLWCGISRADGTLCESCACDLRDTGRDTIIEYDFLPFLPGEYRLSAGIWDARTQLFRAFEHGLHTFSVWSYYREHGTVYLEHEWNIALPKGSKK